MKIAISSSENDLDGSVDNKFGRCDYFLIVNVEDKKVKDFKAIENSAKSQVGGAGVTAGETVAREKVDAVITVNVGPRAFSIFEQFGIKVFRGEGKIRKAIEDFFADNLEELTGSSGPQHAGLR